MYGWRARIGLLIPSANATMEPEFNRFLPGGVSVHVARMVIEELTEAGLSKMEEKVELAARQVAGVAPDLIIFGCTSGSLIKGSRHNEEIARVIEEITGIPAITTSQAVLSCLDRLAIRKVAVATPYNEEINQREKVFLEENAIQVLRILGLGFSRYQPIFPLSKRPISGISLQEPYVAYKLALEAFVPEADGTFISCTNFRTFEIIQKLEIATKKPVVTSNQATLAFALQRLNLWEPIPQLGRLFSQEIEFSRT
jgi:maleate isomerase